MLTTMSNFGLVMMSLSAIWVACLFVAFIAYLVSLFCLFKDSTILLREVRKVSSETFDYLHQGDINSALGIVPYLTISEHFGEFLQSDQMNEISIIEDFKKQCIGAGENVDKNFGRVGIIVFIGISATFAIILTPLGGALFAH